jgi:hypothetical protein
MVRSWPPVAEAVGRDASPSRMVRDTDAAIFVKLGQGARQLRSHLIAGSRFLAVTVSDVMIAICFSLQRFANWRATKLHGRETTDGPCHQHAYQSPWIRVARRSLA